MIRILVVLHRSLVLFHYQSEEHGFVNVAEWDGEAIYLGMRWDK
jgi:hypothetical protein